MNDPEQQLLKPTTTAAPRERRTRLVGAIAAAVFLAAAAVRLGGGGQVFAAPKPSLIDVSSTKSAFRAVQTLKDISGSFYVGQGSFVAGRAEHAAATMRIVRFFSGAATPRLRQRIARGS